jgi:hypothetical protein
MKHLQPKTLRVYLAVLTSPRFSQRGLIAALNRHGSVSIGLVNEVVNDLVRKRFVERTGKGAMDTVFSENNVPSIVLRGGYVVSDVVGLLNLISLFRRMPELRIFTRKIRAAKGDVIKELTGKGAVFCLGSAMEMYSNHFRAEEVSCYASRPDKIREILMEALEGNTRVSCYRSDYSRGAGKDSDILHDPMFAGKSHERALTTKAQTVVDMFCDGKGAYAAPLLKELWGVVV